MDRDYFKKYYNFERHHWWFRIRGKILMNTLRHELNSKQKLTILNIGVATGRTSELLSEFGDVLSVEYDKESFEFCRDELNLFIINASILNLPISDESFDLVCAFDVLEHVDNDELAWNEMVRVCKPGGYIYVSVPMYQFLWSSHDIVNQHVKRYSKKDLINLSDNTKGNIILNIYFNAILFIPIFLFRKFKNLFFVNNEINISDFDKQQNPILNIIFYYIFNFESYMLKFIKFPFGISSLLLWKKNTSKS
jgi:SAM-dependent methyltransferase